VLVQNPELFDEVEVRTATLHIHPRPSHSLACLIPATTIPARDIHDAACRRRRAHAQRPRCTLPQYVLLPCVLPAHLAGHCVWPQFPL
jgi:hypothetical protein